MKFGGILLTLSIALLWASSSSAQQEASKSEDTTASAKAFVNQLAAEDFQNATKNFDSTMTAALPADRLRLAWQSLIAQAGKFKKQLSNRKEKVGSYEIVYVTCEFERTPLDVKVAFNNSKQISGLFFVPSQPAAEY